MTQIFVEEKKKIFFLFIFSFTLEVCFDFFFWKCSWVYFYVGFIILFIYYLDLFVNNKAKKITTYYDR